MVTICEILTADPEGGAARIPYPLFQELYQYLAEVDGDISQEHTKSVYNYLAYYVYVYYQLANCLKKDMQFRSLVVPQEWIPFETLKK